MNFLLRSLGRKDYLEVWSAMRAFTRARTPETPDELWLTEHPPIFTLGQDGREEDLLRDIGVPLVRSDRGGQITYHGPGQLVAYLLFDLRRRRLKAGEMVRAMEEAVLDFLRGHGLSANRRAGAPGVYMGETGSGAKIAALGLRVTNGASYHGLSLNVAMDLSPFAAIHPCGYPGLAVTQLADEGVTITLEEAGAALCRSLAQYFPAPDETGISR
ncbi:MAG: lipoyl(octanoyl) transferase LipB [Zoogloeaceae bacterium]|nr:lipoyl(octanoyl) transferase LipB [Zoogloeaceae bacterium]